MIHMTHISCKRISGLDNGYVAASTRTVRPRPEGVGARAIISVAAITDRHKRKPNPPPRPRGSKGEATVIIPIGRSLLILANLP